MYFLPPNLLSPGVFQIILSCVCYLWSLWMILTTKHNMQSIWNVTTTRLITSNTMSKCRLIFGIEISSRHGVTLIKTQRSPLDMKYSPLSWNHFEPQCNTGWSILFWIRNQGPYTYLLYGLIWDSDGPKVFLGSTGAITFRTFLWAHT